MREEVIKNIVFDIGNVMVKWQPTEVVRQIFPDQNAVQLTQLLFKSSYWLDLNLGKITEAELINIYHASMGIETQKLQKLMRSIKESMLPIDHSFELLSHLHQLRYSLYALTDNVHEIMSYLKLKYNFWNLFKGVVCSAEVGFLKPMPEIYKKLLDTYSLNPTETVFIDDHPPNVEGAKIAGMFAIQFSNVAQCIPELNKVLDCEINI